MPKLFLSYSQLINSISGIYVKKSPSCQKVICQKVNPSKSQSVKKVEKVIRQIVIRQKVIHHSVNPVLWYKISLPVRFELYQMLPMSSEMYA